VRRRPVTVRRGAAASHPCTSSTAALARRQRTRSRGGGEGVATRDLRRRIPDEELLGAVAAAPAATLTGSAVRMSPSCASL
jgi:hypothetical protein